MHPNRRRLLRTALVGAVALKGELTSVQQAAADIPDNLFNPVPIPAQARATEGVAAVNGGRLFFWDTGGDGPVALLMHPISGSALIWPYQQPALAQAGFRVVAYSRRGHFGSAASDPRDEAIASEDLAKLMDFLEIQKFSIVAAAAGCTVTMDFAISHSDRLSAIVFSCGTFSGLDEPEYVEVSKRVQLAGFDAMPAALKELGPSYRATNPDGLKAWIELEHKAVTGSNKARTANRLNWANIAQVRVPTLFLAGAADLYAPPAQMRMVALRVSRAEMTVFPECGHSPHWEMPNAFNKTVIGFLQRHPS